MAKGTPPPSAESQNKAFVTTHGRVGMGEAEASPNSAPLFHAGKEIPNLMPARPLTRAIALLGIGIVVTVLHFVVGTETHEMHMFHVVFRTLYLLVILASALWFGISGGLCSAFVISCIYTLHVAVSWPRNPMENTNQAAMVGVYLLFGVTGGALVHLLDKERRNRDRAERQAERRAVIQSLVSLADALGARDQSTLKHCQNVAAIAIRMGGWFQLHPDRIENLRLAALTHDIGKIGVRDDILFSQAALTPEERSSMERHPLVAADILSGIPGARGIAEIVLAHHECPDGTGYPLGLQREQMSIEAAILSTADIYCALTEERPYKTGIPVPQALEYLHSVAGKKVDARCVLALEEVICGGSQVPNLL